jgi:2'-5' RNA ligase
VRLFVALDLPRSLRERLSWMAGGLPGARWVAPENYHVTLRFIGDLPGWRAEEVDQALANLRAPAFTLQLAGIGTHQKGGKVEALWAGVERSPQLEHLQTKIETALQRAGLERERRRFVPHVTLARLGGIPEAKVAAWVAGHNLFRSDSVPVGHFTLFSSLLGKEQAAYVPEVEYDLLPAAAPAGAQARPVP